MPVDFSGKWKVKSCDANVDEIMTKSGYPAPVIEYMKTKISFETKQSGDDYENTYRTPDGKEKVVKGKIGQKMEDKDLMGRTYTSLTNWEGDKLVSEVTYSDGSVPNSRIVREIKGSNMITMSTLVDAGITSEMVFEKC
ncbi:uncharacterized protein LOC135483676 [Lineus longissimus]|uniref:uncharacterized protein LOC135483676 n=1 Tax=Lineus longissimus TaxID=88925 RepID=UPI002B4F47A3